MCGTNWKINCKRDRIWGTKIYEILTKENEGMGTRLWQVIKFGSDKYQEWWVKETVLQQGWKKIWIPSSHQCIV